ncbi:MAG: glucose-6-phosphate isomerase [Candidatus Glassbacteria bacterium]|nr:glucose-6-phosphate isomerase [Candidatus Glassbacteria bacterium]
MRKWRSKKWQRRMALRLDYNYMMSDFIGVKHGIEEKDLAGLGEISGRVHLALKEKREKGRIGFFDLPYDRETAAKITAFAKPALKRFENVVILGIGGSCLGARALHTALAGGWWANLAGRKARGRIPRFFFADNVDPEGFSRLMNAAAPKKTLYLAISKSGTTAETMSQFLIVHKLLEKEVGRKKVAEHLVVLTDAQQGRLRNIVDREGLTDFIIPDNVGGRFSVFTPVGLLPAALMGIDLELLLAGAAAMDQRTCREDFLSNPAYLAAALLFLADRTRGKYVTVMMSYSDALWDVADWFRQLWAESLGKKLSTSGNAVFTGLTPAKALGVTDQHSQTQLYMEGPFDKVLVFLAVESFACRVPIPALYPELPDVHYLGGHTMEQLFTAERLATEYALAQADRPSFTITLPEVNPFTVGQLLYLLEVQTAFAGGLYNINPFDQPGVELGKHYTYGLMGRSGYDGKREEFENRQPKKDKYFL